MSTAEWVQRELNAMNFQCGYCRLPFKDHNLESLKNCFQQMSEVVKATRKYFCSCGGALTAEEYIVHFLELGHDRGEGPRMPSFPDAVEVVTKMRDVVECHHDPDRGVDLDAVLGVYNSILERLHAMVPPLPYVSLVLDNIEFQHLINTLRDARADARNRMSDLPQGARNLIEKVARLGSLALKRPVGEDL